uniref:Transthyretin/hydroxyisourate hydrolase domain-containing protein n=1 Tax=Bionectria ochroleuca TaxID=29856 RepID=A0A0B7KCA6_BIOOC
MPRPRADQHSGDIPRSPANYLNLLSRHITPKMSNKDPITCHVLDTTAGRPAKGIRGPSRWTLRFDTAGYFGEEHTFFPEATIVFRVEEGQHYHVPLLLSPYSYTTYRGS